MTLPTLGGRGLAGRLLSLAVFFLAVFCLVAAAFVPVSAERRAVAIGAAGADGVVVASPSDSE